MVCFLSIIVVWELGFDRVRLDDRYRLKAAEYLCAYYMSIVLILILS